MLCCRDVFFFSSRRRHTRLQGDWSSDVCSSDLGRIQDGSDSGRGASGGAVAAYYDLSKRTMLYAVAEIGRASCRERGVDLGGRRIIKKKKRSAESSYGLSRRVCDRI